MKVVDASVLVSALADDGPQGEPARHALAREALAAPEIVDIEFLSAMRGLRRSGQLSDRRAEKAITDIAQASVARSPHRPLLQRIWELRDNLSAYDAAYVALAELVEAPLLTADHALASAPGLRCEIVLVG